MSAPTLVDVTHCGACGKLVAVIDETGSTPGPAPSDEAYAEFVAYWESHGDSIEAGKNDETATLKACQAARHVTTA